ncbi:hypothetical protein [Dyadobacter fermentans]|uniref:hypothetical protein n=1 Tax=Dyadobacter fermentans TaxID=94254 RepID=UPI001CBF3417|nr:hypothetical protein [Dyadobacter fermentans]MBZ1360494.1 hypothetical protein [Dyadobacter fermentans]
MKRFFYFGCFILLAAGQFGCSKDNPTPTPEPEPEPIKLEREAVKFALQSRPQYLAEAYRFIGKDSVDLLKLDTNYAKYRNIVFFSFHFDEGYINFWSGSQFPNTEIPGDVKTFNLGIRVDRPTGLRCYWEEEKGTLRIESDRMTDYFPMVILGKKAYLETSSFMNHRTIEMVKAAQVKSQAIFIYEDDDPKLGKVKYKITLKPMYEYYREPNQQWDANFAVF